MRTLLAVLLLAAACTTTPPPEPATEAAETAEADPVAVAAVCDTWRGIVDDVDVGDDTGQLADQLSALIPDAHEAGSPALMLGLLEMSAGVGDGDTATVRRGRDAVVDVCDS